MIYVSKSIATRHGVITFVYMCTGILKSGIEMRHVSLEERGEEREREGECAKNTCTGILQPGTETRHGVFLYTYMYTGIFKPSIEMRHFMCTGILNQTRHT